MFSFPSDIKDEVDQSLTEVNNCFKLLLPHLEEFKLGKDNSKDIDVISTVARKTDTENPKPSTSADLREAGKSVTAMNTTTTSKLPPSTCLEDLKLKSESDLQSSPNACELSSAMTKPDAGEEFEALQEEIQEGLEDGSADVIRESGLGTRSYNISINLNSNGITVDEDEDNTDILNNLRDQNRLITTKYLPTVVKCLTVS